VPIPHPYKFGVLKNADAFGGSFMFFDPGFDLTAEILKCNEEISQKWVPEARGNCFEIWSVFTSCN